VLIDETTVFRQKRAGSSIENEISVIVRHEIQRNDLVRCLFEAAGQPIYIIFVQRRQDLATAVPAGTAVDPACHFFVEPVNDCIDLFTLQVDILEVCDLE